MRHAEKIGNVHRSPSLSVITINDAPILFSFIAKEN